MKSNTKASAKLAKVILAKWSDKERTFHTDAPISLSNEELQKEFDKLPGGIFIVKVKVNSRGLVTEVVMTFDTTESQIFSGVLKAAKSQLYCPVKRGDYYFGGESSFGQLIDVF